MKATETNLLEFLKQPKQFIIPIYLYNLRNCKYLLCKLENYNRSKELVDVENYTIEHIIPQNSNLSVEWQQDLGDNWQ
jgi:hypothetical protein